LLVRRVLVAWTIGQWRRSRQRGVMYRDIVIAGDGGRRLISNEQSVSIRGGKDQN
jgi:hypothetical protein